jgi:hypothetical protein
MGNLFVRGEAIGIPIEVQKTTTTPGQFVQPVQQIQPVQPVQPTQMVQTQPTQMVQTQPTQMVQTQPIQPAQMVQTSQLAQSGQNALAYSASQPAVQTSSSTSTSTSSRSISTEVSYTNPNNLYLLIDVNNLLTCLKSSKPEMDQIQNCVSLYIKGVTINSTGTSYNVTNLISNSPSVGGANTYISQTLSPQQIQQLQTSVFTAYGIPNNPINQVVVNLKNIWLMATTSGDINSAIVASIKGLSSGSGSYINVSQLGSGITVDPNGNMILPQNMQTQQNFEMVENFENLYDTKSLILIACFILYLVILARA